MNRSKIVVLFIVLLPILAGCNTLSHGALGAVIGGGSGLLLGAAYGDPFKGAAIGTVAGAAVGGMHGYAKDKEAALHEQQQARIRADVEARERQVAAEARGITECRTKLSQRASNGAVVHDEIAKDCETYSRRLGDLGERLDVAPPPPVRYEPAVTRRSVQK